VNILDRDAAAKFLDAKGQNLNNDWIKGVVDAATWGGSAPRTIDAKTGSLVGTELSAADAQAVRQYQTLSLLYMMVGAMKAAGYSPEQIAGMLGRRAGPAPNPDGYIGKVSSEQQQRWDEERARRTAQANLDKQFRRALDPAELAMGAPEGTFAAIAQGMQTPRGQGLLATGGGTLEIIGGAFSDNPFLIGLGIDQLVAGARMMGTGEQVSTLTHGALSQGLQSNGYSQQEADDLAGGLEIGVHLAAGFGAGRIPRLTEGTAPKGALLNEGGRASELADAALLKKLEGRGFTIDQSAEIQRYLDYRKANAATFMEKDLLLRPDARKIEVLEEYLHNVQKDIGLMDKMTPAQMEVHVKEFMLRHQKMLGISDADAQWLKNWLDTAKGATGK
jgi:hypothetical protein